ncbi:MAG: MotA/TolQ/ExbB proton channel family protein [Planctomycetes bacterium]|nr:MotA/TolQ/ExbB proton channel family protein [Planctomycetota bacterium]MCB9891167.1 MotA/TolQ/ExbB proton channel family protein [Planctomycetota bacterium]MCB9918934.1 MotA/TolQ/ExbB proton channel family protein [Planctomycetota bacterium]
MTSLLSIARLQTETTVQTVWDFLSSGGPVMIPIALCSLVAVAFTLERLRTLTRSRVIPARLEEAEAKLGAGDHEGAKTILEEMNAPASRILLAGMRRQGHPVRAVEVAMEDQAHKELEKLRGNNRTLHLIAGVAPLLGLLGTVLGIQEAFHRVVKTKMGEPEMLASGIEVALVTTIAGLCVAIPTMLIAAHFSGKSRRLMLACDERLAPWVERLAGKPEIRDAA